MDLIINPKNGKYLHIMNRNYLTNSWRDLLISFELKDGSQLWHTSCV